MSVCTLIPVKEALYIYSSTLFKVTNKIIELFVRTIEIILKAELYVSVILGKSYIDVITGLLVLDETALTVISAKQTFWFM